MSEYQYLSIKMEGKTAIITMERPEVYNALNKAAKLELIQAFRKLGREAHLGSIILTGAGKAFSTGQDLNDRTVQAEQGPVDLGVTLATEWNPLVMAIRQCPKLVIGAINGVCAGAGLSVAMSCDLLVAKPGVKFVSGFAKLGLAPDAGSSFTFVRQLGYQRTLEFFLFNQPLLSEELYNLGLINRVSDDYLEVALNMAQELNSMAPLALEMIKANLQAAQDFSFKSSMDKETLTQRFLGNSQDYQEGLKAFFEKRPPQFQGK